MESARLAAPCLQICKMVFSRHRHCHQPGASCEALPWKVMRPRVAPRTPRPGWSCVGCVLLSTRQDQGDAICLPAALALVFATGKRTDPVQAEIVRSGGSVEAFGCKGIRLKPHAKHFMWREFADACLCHGLFASPVLPATWLAAPTPGRAVLRSLSAHFTKPPMISA